MSETSTWSVDASNLSVSTLTLLTSRSSDSKIDGSFVDPALRQHHTDVLFRTSAHDRDALIEHQSRPDRFMALRMLTYLVRVWNRHAELHPDATRIPIIVPVVIYHGQRRWWPATEFADLFDVGDAAISPTVRFSYHLDELARVTADGLRARHLTAPTLLLFVLLTKRAGQRAPFARPGDLVRPATTGHAA